MRQQTSDPAHHAVRLPLPSATFFCLILLVPMQVSHLYWHYDGSFKVTVLVVTLALLSVVVDFPVTLPWITDVCRTPASLTWLLLSS